MKGLVVGGTQIDEAALHITIGLPSRPTRRLVLEPEDPDAERRGLIPFGFSFCFVSTLEGPVGERNDDDSVRIDKILDTSIFVSTCALCLAHSLFPRRIAPYRTVARPLGLKGAWVRDIRGPGRDRGKSRGVKERKKVRVRAGWRERLRRWACG
jgi:hypothetical protein